MELKHKRTTRTIEYDFGRFQIEIEKEDGKEPKLTCTTEKQEIFHNISQLNLEEITELHSVVIACYASFTKHV